VTNLVFHLVHAPGLPWSVAPLAVYVLGMSLSFPTLTLLALDLFPVQRGLAASCQAFIQTTGAALNAVVAPLVWASVRSLAIAQVVLLTLALAALLLHGWRTMPRVGHRAEGA
jgi:DHA1 family bicyclomycin/chloramphenicol resistance-like MFS transporter